uniref:Uncharacterized protein n=1 Tax=Anguilla anguilla TaxID=7936 RepID=A0A0E9S6T3_ANGAN
MYLGLACQLASFPGNYRLQPVRLSLPTS